MAYMVITPTLHRQDLTVTVVEDFSFSDGIRILVQQVCLSLFQTVN
jgi:hypothetical protein